MIGLPTMRRRQRIAFLLSSLKFGGGERVALNLAAALKAKGYLIDFLLMSHEGEFLSEAHKNFNVIDLRCDRTWKLNLCACLARVFCPSTRLVAWEHSPPTRSCPAWLYAVTASVFYRLANCIVAVSSGVAADILLNTKGLKNRVSVIFNPIPGPANNKLSSYPLNGRRIIWVGRLDVPKNPELMLDAFALLPRTEGYTLDFVGDGRLRDVLKDRAKELNCESSVRFLGFRSDVYGCMTDADMLVLSSDREGLPTVLVEAMHAGLRIVSTDCGTGVHDILQNNRLSTIVPPRDKFALVAAIVERMNMPHDKNPQIAGAQRFAPSRIASQFLHAMGLGEHPK
jgi:glycosyltransferase involved in cell wall biosynthesis